MVVCAPGDWADPCGVNSLSSAVECGGHAGSYLWRSVVSVSSVLETPRSLWIGFELRIEMEPTLEEPTTLTMLRRILLLVLLVGLGGLATELVFLKHLESPAQLIPLGLIAAAFVVIAWETMRPGPGGIIALQILMVLFIAAGLLGMYFHYVANVEFQREIDPSIGGAALFWKAMAAKTPPALAPGSMLQLGLIGLAYAYRHPALGSPGTRV